MHVRGELYYESFVKYANFIYIYSIQICDDKH